MADSVLPKNPRKRRKSSAPKAGSPQKGESPQLVAEPDLTTMGYDDDRCIHEFVRRDCGTLARCVRDCLSPQIS